MQMRRVSYVVLVIMLWALVIGASEGVRRTKQTFFRDDWVSHEEEIDEDMAEQVWYYCRGELIGGIDGAEDLDLYPQEAASQSEAVYFPKSNIHDAILVLPPHVKQKLVDCLRNKGIVFHASGKTAHTNNWLISYFDWLLGTDIGPRRYLASGSPKSKKAPAPSPARAPSPAPAPARARAPSPAPSPARAPSPAPAPARAPSPAPSPARASSPAPAPGPGRATGHGKAAKVAKATGQTQNPAAKEGNKKAPASSGPPPKPSGKENPSPTPSGKGAVSSPPAKPAKTNSPPAKTNDAPSKDGGNNMMKIMIIAAASVVVVLIISITICCCCCCLKKRRRSGQVNPKIAQKDDRPLLYLSSGGSSQVSNSLGSSGNEFNAGGKLGNLSMKNGNGNNSSEANSLLPPPPGKAVVPPPPGKAAVPPPPGNAAPPPPGPPPPPPPRQHPPPPPKAAPKPMPGKSKFPPLGHQKEKSADGADFGTDSGKTKLKPFFWDKVNANPDQSMIWHELREGSFQFNEEKIESLFGYTRQDKPNVRSKDRSSEPAIQYIQIIEKKKAQNLSILLKALNVTTSEVSEALLEGSELPVELLQNLLKLAPTSEEELKLRLYTGDLFLLGPADRFLKSMVDIPFAFKRMEALCFMCSFTEEVSDAKESFATLEVACNKLRKSRLFLKLLEAVLKTGNRMNDGTYRGGAQAFRLDTLLKLADVKGTDGKTSLLHFVVQEIIRYEGIKAARNARESSRSRTDMSTEEFAMEVGEESAEHYRNLGLQLVSGLPDELKDVRKAAAVDADSLTALVSSLRTKLLKTRNFVRTDLKDNMNEDCAFYCTIDSFLERAQGDVTFLLEEEKRINTLVKSTADYFHGNAMKDEGIRLFIVVRDFLVILTKVCDEIRKETMKKAKANSRKEALTEARSKKEALTEAGHKKETLAEAGSDKQSEMKKEASSETKEETSTEASSEKKEETPTEASSETKEEASTKPSVEKKEKAPTEASAEKKEKAPTEESSEKPVMREKSSDMRRRLFPAIAELRIEDDFSSDDET